MPTMTPRTRSHAATLALAALLAAALPAVSQESAGPVYNVEVIVFRQNLKQLRRATRDDIDDAGRKIAGVKELIQIADDERVALRRNGDDGVADSNGGQDEREQWRDLAPHVHKFLGG